MYNGSTSSVELLEELAIACIDSRCNSSVAHNFAMMLLLLLLLLRWLIKVLFRVGIGSGSGILTLANVIIVRDDEGLLIELGRRLLLLLVRHKFITTWQWRWCWRQVFTLLWLLLFIGVSTFTRGRFRRGCSDRISFFSSFIKLILQNDGLGKRREKEIVRNV